MAGKGYKGSCVGMRNGPVYFQHDSQHIGPNELLECPYVFTYLKSHEDFTSALVGMLNIAKMTLRTDESVTQLCDI